MEKTKKYPILNKGEFKVEKIVSLNFFDLTGKKAKTQGTSNKVYTAEVQVSTTDNRAQIYTIWGPTGGNQTEDWRHYTDQNKARKEFESIIKSKIKKGYKEIDIAQRAYGSEEAKQITKAVQLKNVDAISSSDNIKQSTLHLETQRLISSLMGATNQFVIQTLKCPLGQLTNTQIDEGRARLNEAKIIVSKYTGKSIPTRGKDFNRLEELTNDFYSLIPHNLGSGARGQMSHLLLDDLKKIDQKECDLDTLLDAKAIGASLTSNSVDDQYKSLNTDFNFIDHEDERFKWLNNLIQKTRAANHNFLGKIVLLNAWAISRNKEFDTFFKSVKEIAPQCGKQVIPNALKSLIENRKDIKNDVINLYKEANVIPLFHGTKTVNLCGIFNKGILIRPAGAIITGAMYGNSAYWAPQATKSILYSSINNSYWARGTDDKGYLFIADCCLGNQKLANGPYQYTENNIKPYHSVWARGGHSGVINDEFMLYNTKQHNLRYLLEFTCR